MIRRSHIVALFTVATVVASGVAQAAWSSAGTGAARAAASTINPAASPGATVNAQTVTVTWSPPAGGAAPASYSVTRAGVAVCASVTSPLQCIESNVPSGTHSYSVTSRLQNWTSASVAVNATVSAQVTPFSTTISDAGWVRDKNQWTQSVRLSAAAGAAPLVGATIAWTFDSVSGSCTTGSDGACPTITSPLNGASSKTMTIGSATRSGNTWTGSESTKMFAKPF